MNKKYFSIFVIALFILILFNQPVYAQNINEQERVLYIEPEEVTGLNYSSVLNILNETNHQYTNENVLIESFE